MVRSKEDVLRPRYYDCPVFVHAGCVESRSWDRFIPRWIVNDVIDVQTSRDNVVRCTAQELRCLGNVGSGYNHPENGGHMLELRWLRTSDNPSAMRTIEGSFVLQYRERQAYRVQMHRDKEPEWKDVGIVVDDDHVVID